MENSYADAGSSSSSERHAVFAISPLMCLLIGLVLVRPSLSFPLLRYSLYIHTHTSAMSDTQVDIPAAAQAYLDHPFDLSLIPCDLEHDDALSQTVALKAVIKAQHADADEDASFFEQPVQSLSLGHFRRIYERNDSAAALKLMSRRVHVNFEGEDFVTPSDSGNISWSIDRHFIDMLVCVGKDLGLGAILPNENANSFYNVKLDFTKKGKAFKAKNVTLGFDPAGSMLWVGNMPSADDIWIAWIPRHSSNVHEQSMNDNMESTCLSERHYRITVMFFAFMLRKIVYRDIMVPNPYPDLSCDNAFRAATNLL